MTQVPLLEINMEFITDERSIAALLICEISPFYSCLHRSFKVLETKFPSERHTRLTIRASLWYLHLEAL